jgi:hypothetical protein
MKLADTTGAVARGELLKLPRYVMSGGGLRKIRHTLERDPHRRPATRS